MPNLPKLKLVPALFALVALLAVPAAAQATLAYTTNVFHPHVTSREDNGKGAKRIGAGTNPKVSPDGEAGRLRTGTEPRQGAGNEALRRRDGEDEDALLALARKLYVRLVPGLDHGGGAAGR